MAPSDGHTTKHFDEFSSNCIMTRLELAAKSCKVTDAGVQHHLHKSLSLENTVSQFNPEKFGVITVTLPFGTAQHPTRLQSSATPSRYLTS